MSGTMVAWAIERVGELRTELAAANDQLGELDRAAADVRAGMLRISGAIQVLEELIAASGVFDETAER